MLSFNDVNVGDTVKVTKDGTTVEGVVEQITNDHFLTIGPVCIYNPYWDLVECRPNFKSGDVATFVVDGFVYAGVYDSISGNFISGEENMFSDKCAGIKVYGNFHE